MFSLPLRASRHVLADVQMIVAPLAFAPGVSDSWMPLVTGVTTVALLVGFARGWGYVSGRPGNEGDGDAPVAE